MIECAKQPGQAAFTQKLNIAFHSLERIRCPTICVIDGIALGGGCELSLCSDIRVSTVDAIFGFPETGLAFIPGMGGTHRM